LIGKLLLGWNTWYSGGNEKGIYKPYLKVEYSVLQINSGSISFEGDAEADSIGYSNSSDRWVFQNISMNGETVSYWWITSQNGNVTIQDLFRIDRDYGLKFTWSGSGTGTVSFYSGMGEWGKPYYIKIDGIVYQESSSLELG